MAAWMWALGSAAVSLWSGYKQSQAAKDTGNAQYYAAMQNAQDMLRLSGVNSELLMSVAAENAQAYNYVGDLNAQAIERATGFNMALTKIETEEDIRRHYYQERMVAGGIRAAASGAGVQVNTGTPLHFLGSQMHQAFLEREYIANRGSLILQSQYTQGMDAAFIAREEARIRGEVEIRNAAAQAEMMSMESFYRALSTSRDASLYQQIGYSNASSAMWGGWANAFNSFASIYGIMR